MKISTENTLALVNPELTKQWHPTKNDKLTPEQVTPNANKKVWWVCEKEHEWEAIIASRHRGNGCPYCANRIVCKDNCLETTHSELAKEWHPTKNGGLTPKDVVAGSGKKAWWCCSKGHEWQVSLDSRSKGSNCPYCLGQLIHEDNCLETTHSAIAIEWHPTKNGKFSPKEVGRGNKKKVWWLCSNSHAWQTSVHSRVSKGTSCPYCSGRKACEDNNLMVLKPELAAEWNFLKNKDLTPLEVTPTMSKKVWWICLKGHEWIASINDRNAGTGCPYCANRVINNNNCLETTHPVLSKEWHIVKNKDLTPKDVSYGSKKVVWWQCKKGHEWQSPVSRRSTGNGCPYCAGQKVCLDNCLQTLDPQLSKEWHPTKNGNLTPKELTMGSNKKIWWICDKGHEWKTTIRLRYRNNCPHCNNFHGTSFPEQIIYFYIKKVFEDALNRYKIESLDFIELDVFIPSLKLGIEYDGYLYHRDKTAKDENKNQILHENRYDLIRIREKSGKDVLPEIKHYNFIHFEYEYDYTRENQELKKIISKIFNYIINTKTLSIEILNSIYNLDINIERDRYQVLSNIQNKQFEKSLSFLNPTASEEWDFNKNYPLTPKDISANSERIFWWKCIKGHDYEMSPQGRNRGRGCPYCAGRRVSDYNSLKSLFPEVSSLWNFNKNGNLRPDDVTSGSAKKVWWICESGHEWERIIGEQVKAINKCPHCYKEKRKKG